MKQNTKEFQQKNTNKTPLAFRERYTNNNYNYETI